MMAHVALARPNGLHPPSQTSDATVSDTGLLTAKRKREPSDPDSGPTAIKAARDQKQAVQNFFRLLQRIDISPSILQHPLEFQVFSESDRPQAKVQKTDSRLPSTATTVAAKVAREEYESITDLAEDAVLAAESQVSHLRLATPDGGNRLAGEVAILETMKFKVKVLEHVRRESLYPLHPVHDSDGHRAGLLDSTTTEHPLSSGSNNIVLTAFANAPHPRYLFSSLLAADSHPSQLAAASLAVSQRRLPHGVTHTTVLPSRQTESVPTLGELFAPTQPVPLLRPPTPTVQVTGGVLTFQRPEQSDSSRAPSSSYGFQKISVGCYLDYSNATIPPASSPPSRSTGQQERVPTQPGYSRVVGNPDDLDMDALFRRVFSSFAPCKDDSNAVVPASVAARLWWRRTGRTSFDQMIATEYPLPQGIDEAAVDGRIADPPDAVDIDVDIDEAGLRQVIETWDENLVDPMLDAGLAPPHGHQAEKDTDSRLLEVTNLIETLSSYQRIRNLDGSSAPASHSTSTPSTAKVLPAREDSMPMSSEERATYYRLRDRLSCLVSQLPPYALYKLHGNKLGQLLISTKMQVLTDHYTGVTEPDEPPLSGPGPTSIRVRPPLSQTVNMASPRSRPLSGTPLSVPVPYTPSQFGSQNRGPIQTPPAQYYRPGAAQAQTQPMAGQTARLSAHAPPRPVAGQHYRTPNGYTSSYPASKTAAAAVGQSNSPGPYVGAPAGAQHSGQVRRHHTLGLNHVATSPPYYPLQMSQVPPLAQTLQVPQVSQLPQVPPVPAIPQMAAIRHGGSPTPRPYSRFPNGGGPADPQQQQQGYSLASAMPASQTAKQTAPLNLRHTSSSTSPPLSMQPLNQRVNVGTDEYKRTSTPAGSRDAPWMAKAGPTPVPAPKFGGTLASGVSSIGQPTPFDINTVRANISSMAPNPPHPALMTYTGLNGGSVPMPLPPPRTTPIPIPSMPQALKPGRLP